MHLPFLLVFKKAKDRKKDLCLTAKDRSNKQVDPCLGVVITPCSIAFACYRARRLPMMIRAKHRIDPCMFDAAVKTWWIF